jgi:hypothetical protein
MYFLFTFLIPVIEIYKIYFESQCENQEFVIRKTISTKDNICLPIFQKKFLVRNPTLKINDKEEICDFSEDATLVDEKTKDVKLDVELNNNDNDIYNDIDNDRIDCNLESNLNEPLLKQK